MLPKTPNAATSDGRVSICSSTPTWSGHGRFPPPWYAGPFPIWERDLFRVASGLGAWELLYFSSSARRQGDKDRVDSRDLLFSFSSSMICTSLRDLFGIGIFCFPIFISNCVTVCSVPKSGHETNKGLTSCGQWRIMNWIFRWGQCAAQTELSKTRYHIWMPYLYWNHIKTKYRR